MVFYQSTMVENIKVLLKKSKDMLKKEEYNQNKICQLVGVPVSRPLDCKDYTCKYTSVVYTV